MVVVKNDSSFLISDVKISLKCHLTWSQKKNWKTRTKKIWHEHWKQKIPLLGPISGSPRLEEPSSFFQLSLSSRGYLIQSLLCQKRPSSGNQGQRVEGFNWLSVTQDNKPTKIGNWNLGLKACSHQASPLFHRHFPGPFGPCGSNQQKWRQKLNLATEFWSPLLKIWGFPHDHFHRHF